MVTILGGGGERASMLKSSQTMFVCPSDQDFETLARMNII
jgi:hypothetical protein